MTWASPTAFELDNVSSRFFYLRISMIWTLVSHYFRYRIPQEFNDLCFCVKMCNLFSLNITILLLTLSHQHRQRQEDDCQKSSHFSFICCKKIIIHNLEDLEGL